MGDNDLQLMTQLAYYMREGYYQTVRKFSVDALQKFVNDPVLQFFAATAQLLQGQKQEAIRGFLLIDGHPDVSLGAILGLIEAHKAAEQIDREALTQLRNRHKDEGKGASDKSNYYGAALLFFCGDNEKAKELIEKAIKMNNQSPMFLCLKGWIDLSIGRDMKAALKAFQDATAEMSSNQVYLDPYLGQCRYHEHRQNQQGMHEALAKAAAHSPNFLPVHIERIKAHLMKRQWDLSLETAQRCLVIDSHCIEAQKYLILYTICYEGNYSEAVGMLKDILISIESAEPKNAKVYSTLARVCMRVCGRDREILEKAKTLYEKALAANKSAETQAEYARLLRVFGQPKAAVKAYKLVLEMPSATGESLLGLVQCHLMENNLSEAEAQLEFIKATDQDVVKSSMFLYLEALIAKTKNKSSVEVAQQLQRVISSHFTRLQTICYGADYFAALDPDFVTELVGEMFDFVPFEPAKSAQQANPLLKEIQHIVSVVSDACPGLSEATYLLGKAKYLSAQTDEAQTILQKCLNTNQTYSDAHLLIAQIYLQKGNFKMANQSLEVGLSFNFKVRDHPIYHLIKARILKRSNNIDGSVVQLENAMKLPTFKQPSTTHEPTQDTKSRLELTEADRVAVYLELIDSYQILHRTEDATRLMKTALEEFSGTKEQDRLMLCSAELALTAGDADRALQMLATVDPSQPNYLAAKQKMADIYLHHKKDKRQFAMCFKELVENSPSTQAYVMLGDAYMGVTEPEKAIEVYEYALKKNPRDTALARKIGQAYVQAHLYNKAVNYYEAALKTGQQNFLRQDLAELLFRLKNYDKCEKILMQGLEKTGGAVDVMTMIDEVKFMELLSKLYFEKGDWQRAVNTLTQAKDQQERILKRNPNETPDVAEQKRLAARINCQLGQFYENQRELQKSVGYYREALAFVENDSKIMLSLAHLYLATGQLDECNTQCEILLKIDRNNDQATLMVADLMYQRNETDAAMIQYQQLLDRNPNQYHGLARLIELTWRNGDVESAEKYLKAALDRNPRASLDAGFNYCKGLHEWYTADPNAALQHFNRARRDLEWGERAIYNMIEICLNPDNEIIGGEVFDHGSPGGTAVGGPDGQDARQMGVRTAERFLKELRFKPGLDYKYRLMENFILLSTKNRTNVDEALKNFSEMGGGEGEDDEEVTNVGAVLGLARGYMILKQNPKAKAQLKRILNHPWTLEDADYLEQCWLLLADAYINQSKYEAAIGVLRTVLQHNASCIKAFEYMGFLREKEQKWVDAGTNYEEAWKLTKKRNPTIGYKLAYNHLKSKRLVDAIDTCHRVLQLYPNYPKIRREVLEKARSNLRM